ncbi:Di-copper centre-containing protein [Conidiobolus coronatus NRRL 28638]|uniref:Di-copper centre-containing protein n=1 Tax=Conidiobolus coronatus (strain ATCC 28846 / CBS 209.66 / NRRL 28638) TaxID=796925 RepID=A0A137P4M5_CONC2|nr:Di-copper centre-containing protein [Conidiobolus coronatus NRRL 28638]|eukprot:KXN69968.1 Di-copper centre-containing protein [Conidiobolus coronatus NRRL 28638]
MLFNAKFAFVLSLFITSSNAQNQGGCDRIVTRPNIKSLSSAQVREVIDVIYQVHNNKDLLYKISKIHYDHKDEAHGVPAFLPWHRQYLREFEKEMQKIKPGIVLPFWDWSRDSQAPERSFIFTPEYFGGNGQGRNLCVSTGKFANLQLTYPRPHCLARNFDEGDAISSFYSPESVENVIARGTTYDVFRRNLEGTPHGLVHNNIGGNGGDISTMYSTNDPIFWMHHAFIDLIWFEWQQRNPRLAATYNGGSARSTDRLMPYNVPVSAVFDTKSPGYCYQYPRYSARVPPVDIENPPPINQPSTTASSSSVPQRTTTPAQTTRPATSNPSVPSSRPTQPTRPTEPTQPTTPPVRPQPPVRPEPPVRPQPPVRPTDPRPPQGNRPNIFDWFNNMWDQIWTLPPGRWEVRFGRRHYDAKGKGYPVYPIPTTTTTQVEAKTTTTCKAGEHVSSTTCNGNKDKATTTENKYEVKTTTENKYEVKTTTTENKYEVKTTTITKSAKDQNGYPTKPITTVPSYPTDTPPINPPTPPTNSTSGGYDKLTPPNAGPRLREYYRQIPHMKGYLSPKDRQTQGKIRIPKPLPSSFIEMNGYDPLDIRNHELDIAILCAKLNNDETFKPEVGISGGSNGDINSSGSNEDNQSGGNYPGNNYPGNNYPSNNEYGMEYEFSYNF